MANGAAKLNVLMSGGFSGAYKKLLPDFQRSNGIDVATGSGASQGAGPQTIAAQLARGVSADVVILSREGLDDLFAANKIATGTDVDLACVGLGLAVPAGSTKPLVTTVDDFKNAMLKAKCVAIPESTSGIWLTAELFPRLGIASKISVKSMPRGMDAARAVAAGQADFAILPVSEIMDAPNVDLAGSLAPDIQFMQTFSAAVVAGSPAVTEAKRLIAHLASAPARAAISASGMEPLATGD